MAALSLVVLVVLIVLSLSVLSLVVLGLVLAGVASSRIVLGVSIASVGTASVGTGVSPGVSPSIRITDINVATSAVDGRESREALGGSNLGNRESGGVEGLGQRLGRVCVLRVGAIDIWVDERDDSTEFLCRWEGCIGTQAGDVDSEGVEVLLRSDESGGGLEDGRVVAESIDDLIC